MLRKLLELLSDAAVYGATSIIGQVISFCLLPLYTSYLTPKDYGIIAMLNIISVVYQPLANLGISNAIFRRYNKCKDEAERRVALSTGLLGVLASSGILLVLTCLACRPLTVLLLETSEGTDLVLLTLATGFVTSINAVPQTTLRAERRVKTIGVLNLIELTTTIAGTILLVAVLKMGVFGAVLGASLGEVVFGCALFATTFRSFRFTLERSTLVAMLKYGLPLVPHQLQAVGLSYVSQYMLRYEVGLRDAGLFNMAQKFALPVSMVVNAIQRAWVPYKFQIHAKDDDPVGFFRTATTYYLAGTTYLWMGVSVWGPEVVRLMTTSSFHDAGRLVAAAALIPFAFGVRSMLTTGRELSDNTGPLPLVAFFGLVAVVISSYLLIPPFGAMGAAFATSLGWLVMAAGGYWLAQRVFPIDYQWTLIGGFMAVAVGFVYLFERFAESGSTATRVGTAAVMSVAYPVVVALLLYRTPAERERMRSVWSRLSTRGAVDRPARS